MPECAGVLVKVASCVYIRPRRVSPRSYVRGFENGRRSYELALEDNYDGDPGTAIHYALNAVTRAPDEGGPGDQEQ